MHSSIDNLNLVKTQLSENNSNATIVVVSKTFSMEKIEPLISYGHYHFGENKVQEAVNKWSDVKKSNNKIKLHMIGKLQTNKVKNVVPLFDYIHSLDNLKLAEKISKEQKKINKSLKIFIQINIGDEDQKNGINENNLQNFYSICKNELNLDIVGIMCLPPKNKDVNTYFKKMLELKKKIGVVDLSMGMSSDYIEAIKFESSFLRIGSKILGERS